MPRRKSRLVVGLALLAALVGGGLWLGTRGAGDEPSAASPTAPSEPAGEEPRGEPSLSGRVIEAHARRGVEGAQVEVRCEALGEDRPRLARADERGHFAFEWLPPGRCTVGARAPGYVAGGPVTGRPLEVVVRAEQPLVDLSVPLVRAAVVAGRVMAGGRPVEGVTLSVLYLESPGEPESFSLSPDLTTDAGGRFTLGDLPPGRVQLLAESDAYAMVESEELFLRPGDRLTDIVLQLAGGGEVVGDVVDEGGRPVEGARVQLAASGARGVRRVQTDRRGQFVFDGVAPGRVVVLVRATGYEPERVAGVEVVAGDAVEVRVVLRAQVGFGGVVRSPDGAPVASAAIHLAPAGAVLPRGHVPIRPVAYTDDDGHFWVTRLPEAPSEVFATHPAYAPSERVALSGEPDEAVELWLGPGGRLIGRVVDERGEPMARFHVAVHGFRPAEGGRARRSGLPHRDVADPAGAFVFEGLTPGTYDLRVWADGYPAALSRGHTVTADAETEAGTIVLRRGGAVSGVVIDAETGEPVARASVRVSGLAAAAAGRGGVALTDADGRFRVSGLPGDRLSLRVNARGYVTRLVSGVEAPGGGESDAGVIALKPVGEGGAGRMQYSGIGAVLGRRGDNLVVRRVFDGSPSSESGLEAGTEILRVNGSDTGDLELQQAVEMIRGESGSEVTLEVLRPGETYPETVRVMRGEVVTPRGGRRPRPRLR